MAFKLAITVAGAVSLGAYEAGVLYEIVDAIGQHNSRLPADSHERIEIDVLTGASAGGMSAAVLAQKLLYQAGELEGPYENALYRVWVEDLEFESLMTLQHSEDPSHSILSSDFIETLSRKYLTARYATTPAPSPQRHAASAKHIRLGLALANLNGVDYRFDLLPQGAFTYTRFQDEKTALLDEAADKRETWEPLRQAAVSCGAFPFAFRVKPLERDHAEFAEFDPNHLAPFESPRMTFTYTDGGTFQNQPLGLAKNLVDKEDPLHEETESRFYMFISPHDKGSDSSSAFNAANANFFNLAGSLVNSVFNQAGFQDWILAESVNAKVRTFNKRAMELHGALLNGSVPPKPLEDAVDLLLPKLLDSNAFEAASTRLKKQFQAEYDQLIAMPSNGQNAARCWIKSILLLETAADLGERDEMTIFGVTANSTELAGAALQAFLGFFMREYRDHDYDVGRTKAQAFLKRQSGTLPLKGYVPKPIRPINDRLNGLQLKDVPLELRKDMLARLESRANDLLKEAGVDFLGREAIELLLLPRLLKRVLEISDDPEGEIS